MFYLILAQSEPLPYAEVRAVIGIALGLVLITAALAWLLKQRKRNGNGESVESRIGKVKEEMERKAIAAGEQPKDWWVNKITEICQQANEEQFQSFTAYFNVRFDRLESLLEGKTLSPFSPADILERRRRPKL